MKHLAYLIMEKIELPNLLAYASKAKGPLPEEVYFGLFSNLNGFSSNSLRPSKSCMKRESAIGTLSQKTLWLTQSIRPSKYWTLALVKTCFEGEGKLTCSQSLGPSFIGLLRCSEAAAMDRKSIHGQSESLFIKL